MGKVMGDLSSRRGKIQGMDMEGGFQMIKALVPAKELYRYSSTLRSLTGGRGVHCGDVQPLRRNAARGGAEGRSRKASAPSRRSRRSRRVNPKTEGRGPKEVRNPKAEATESVGAGERG